LKLGNRPFDGTKRNEVLQILLRELAHGVGRRVTIKRQIMATARKVFSDPMITPFYHGISRRVRRAFLCRGENAHRKQWIEDRLQELAGIFAFNVCGFAILDSHLYVLPRLDLAGEASNG
jgi:hypothetical protein